MVAQVCRGIEWVHRKLTPEIVLCGHSSGGHLAACALVMTGLPSAALLVSGIYDLLPVRLSARNEYLRLDEKLEQEYSPIRHIDKIRGPVTVAWGEHEAAEFDRQSREFAKKVGAPTIIGHGLNHFEMIETLADPASPLARAAYNFLR
jgi:arylformamidase